jgi:hypothetical protein
MSFPSRCFLVSITAGPVVTVGKPERLLCRLFQAAVEIIKQKLPKPLFRFPRLRQFPQASASRFPLKTLNSPLWRGYRPP